MNSAPLIDWSSPYLTTLKLQEDDAQHATALIAGATAWIEKFCNRSFAQQTFDKVVTVGQDQSVILPNPPIAYISRILTASQSWFRLQNTTATTASYGTSPTGINLFSMTAGVPTYTTLTWADYPSLGSLADAVNDVSGWTASVTSGFDDQASADLVHSQGGNCRTGAVVLTSWCDDARQVSFNPGTGIIEGWGGVNWNEPYPLCFNTVGAASFFAFYGFARYQQIRVVYVGGFAPQDMPEPIKQVCGNLVISAFQSPEGRAEQVTIGGQYSYSLMDYDKLAVSDKKVLSFYRDRWI